MVAVHIVLKPSHPGPSSAGKAAAPPPFWMRCLGLAFEVSRWWYVLFFVLCMGSLLMFDTLHTRELDRMRSERFNLFLTDLREKVETDLRIGFGIEQDRGAQARIDELIRQAPELRSIEIFDLSGKAVASTDRGTVGETVETTWLKAVQDAHGAVWRHASVDEIVFGVPVRNAFGEIAGQIAVTYQPRPWSETARLWTDPQTQIFLFVVVFLGLIVPMILIRSYAFSLAAEEHFLNYGADSITPVPTDQLLVAAKAELNRTRAHLQGIKGELDEGP
jgi:hypothetical protein